MRRFAALSDMGQPDECVVALQEGGFDVDLHATGYTQLETQGNEHKQL